jgi:hypothetical protein
VHVCCFQICSVCSHICLFWLQLLIWWVQQQFDKFVHILVDVTSNAINQILSPIRQVWMFVTDFGTTSMSCSSGNFSCWSYCRRGQDQPLGWFVSFYNQHHHPSASCSCSNTQECCLLHMLWRTNGQHSALHVQNWEVDTECKSNRLNSL